MHRQQMAVPKNDVARVVGRQMLPSGTSIDANYREASRCATRKHFASTMSIAMREADETLCWLELLAEPETVKPSMLSDLVAEYSELVASVKTATK